MAVIWQKQTKETRYEIRSAGNSIRLYTNQVFHSQFNARNSVTGNVWDLLSLPVFLFPTVQPLRVLLLGVGGGAVIRQLQHWRGDCDITGIELNKVHLTIAKRFFGITPQHARLIHADARAWVSRQHRPQYDLIIDDLFGHSEGEPQRAIAATRDWAQQLTGLLKPSGIIVTNFGDRQELVGSAYCACAPVRDRFPLRFQLSTPLYENRIGVFSRREHDLRGFRSRIKTPEPVRRALRSNMLNYTLRRL